MALHRTLRMSLLLCGLAIFAGTSALAVENPAVQAADDMIRSRDFAGAFAALSAPELASDAEAVWRLASLYEAGLGVEKDATRALELTRRAAELDPIEALRFE